MPYYVSHDTAERLSRQLAPRIGKPHPTNRYATVVDYQIRRAPGTETLFVVYEFVKNPAKPDMPPWSNGMVWCPPDGPEGVRA